MSDRYRNLLFGRLLFLLVLIYLFALWPLAKKFIELFCVLFYGLLLIIFGGSLFSLSLELASVFNKFLCGYIQIIKLIWHFKGGVSSSWFH